MNIIFLIIFFPLLGFLFLSFSQGVLSKKITTNIGIFSILMPFIINFLYGINFMQNTSLIFTQQLCQWISINEFNVCFGLFLDGLSLSMLSIIIGIGLLIHIFSSWYMKYKEGYSRFFSYTNLFIASMSLLVLADNFLLMYLGWEGVSICSYLLIGFYYKTEHNNLCAFKAFILTRISDVFLMIGMFLVYQEYSTFNFQEIKFLSTFIYPDNYNNLNLIAFFLLIGVIGKSAQLPLQTWLSDAMVGPTPVSALIHAATMVTVGVYLVARIHFLFLLAPSILYVLSLVGILTIFISSFSALVQTDIKKILAYSTMSQIGYMFLALGVEAWSAAITHLMVHAIFKALLFLSAGSLIISSNNEKNIFKMGGLCKKLPFLYITFLVGGGSLISFPLFTSGFYSKGNILFSVFQSGHFNLFVIGLFCSFLTSLYTFRMIFVIFHGNSSVYTVISNKALTHNIPLLVLLILSTAVTSYISLPLFYVFPVSNLLMNDKLIFEIISSVLSVFGVYLSYYFWIKKRSLIYRILQFKYIRYAYNFILKGWGFDWFYNLFFVNCYLSASKILSYDPFNKIICFFTSLIQMFNLNLLKTNNGYIRWYIGSMILGVNLIFILVLLFNGLF